MQYGSHALRDIWKPSFYIAHCSDEDAETINVECRCRIVDIGDIDMLWVTWPSVGAMHAFFRHLNIAFHPANQSWCTFHMMILMRITQFKIINALCNVKLSIRYLSQISTMVPIFQQYNYFRQNSEENVTFTFYFFLVLPQISLVKYYDNKNIDANIWIFQIPFP